MHVQTVRFVKVVVLNTFDISGGAARAAYRVHVGLRRIGVDSTMLVKFKASDDESVTCIGSALSNRFPAWSSYLDLAPLVRFPRRHWTPWSVGWVASAAPTYVRRSGANIAHLHWVCRGLLSIRAFAELKVPLVWTLHDMWAFTGGCHYAGDCVRYKDSCGACPQLGSHKEEDLSRRGWRQKKKYWEGLDLTVVTPSKWLVRCACESSLLRNVRVEVIPNGLDTRVFQPKDRASARVQCGLPVDKQIILVGGIKGTSDERKGFGLIQPALAKLAALGLADKAELAVFGETAPPTPVHMGLKTTYLGHFADDSKLASLYSAADVFVAPSIQENLANTVMESLSCGTPCVAFDIGGMPDMIEHQKNGYLARPFEPDDLAHGIAWILQDGTRRTSLAAEARMKAETEFDETLAARRYADLYEDILKAGRFPQD